MTIVAASERPYAHTSRTLITADAVAARTGLPKSTVYELARTGRIGGAVRLGRSLRFDPERLEAWLADGGTGVNKNA